MIRLAVSDWMGGKHHLYLLTFHLSWTETPLDRAPPPYSKERAVHILLGCILVLDNNLCVITKKRKDIPKEPYIRMLIREK